MASSGATQKLKILCIHGYRQNAQSFRERTGAFRKFPIVKKQTDLVFITAPNRVPSMHGEEAPGDGQAAEGLGETGWWFSAPDNTYMAQEFTDCCKGYQESLDMVTEVFKTQGPFDGILSFSQGASFASLLCGIQQQNPDINQSIAIIIAKIEINARNGRYSFAHSPIKFNFVILVAGFKSRQSAHEHLYKEKITVPSLHVFGDTDKVIQKDMSEALLQHFVEPVILQHEGGHFIPTTGAHKQVYTQFLQKMLDSRASNS
ncbi:esterase OVCA2-like isoform X2 [Mya arenaria]|uniref:esterase OVCA2-like isoform X2 n=1 Tax=Mya arenaria TaxID=6604 RepID=UPI0022E49DB3|nr:esterase OVCA2-like isoform X2 [Mya arenaria]